MCQQRSVYWLILSRSTSTKGNHGSAKGKLEAVFSLLLSLFARKRGKKRMEEESFFSASSWLLEDIQPFAPVEQHKKMAVWSLVTSWPRWNTKFTINCFSPREETLLCSTAKTPWHKRPKSAFFLNMKIHDFRKPRHTAAKRSFGVDKNCCLSLWNCSINCVAKMGHFLHNMHSFRRNFLSIWGKESIITLGRI